MANLPVWPPAELSDESRESLLEWAVDWALGHSLVLRPADSSRLAVIHAPFSLLPTPFKSHAFIVAKSLQPAYNDLYANIAASPGFLHQTLAPLARVDSFQAGLYEVYKKTYEQTKDQFTLGLFRSDYLLHSEDGLPKQVEFNTVSSSFGPLSTRVSQMHREAALAGLLPDCIKLEQLPPNEALDQLADGLAAAHKLFNKPERYLQNRYGGSDPVDRTCTAWSSWWSKRANATLLTNVCWNSACCRGTASSSIPRQIP